MMSISKIGSLDPTNLEDLKHAFAVLHKPRNFKKYGQNFLIDARARDEIIAAARLNRSDQVLEIGCGSGVLTQQLVQHAGHVTALDIDPYLLEVTRLACADAKNLDLRLEDVRKINLPKLFCERGITDYKLVSNVPYYLTGYLLELFLSSPCPPSLSVLTIQKEVADRVLAKPGDYTLLTVSVQVFGSAKLVQTISRRSFWPQPNVDSAVITLERHAKPLIAPTEQKKFFRVVKAGFSARRKKLSNALAGGLRLDVSAAQTALKAADLPPKARAQELTIQKWAELSQKIEFST